MNFFSPKCLSLLMLASLLHADVSAAPKKELAIDADTRQSCPTPSANFCSINANCVNVNTLIATGNVTFDGTVDITNTTPTTSCDSGALVVAGGVGIGGDLNVCGHATFGGARSIGRAVPCTGPTLEVEVLGDEGISGDLFVCGDEFVGGNLTVNGTLTASGGISVTGPLVISNTTQSTGCTSGALVVAGGVGIGKNLNVCGQVNNNIGATYTIGVDFPTIQAGIDFASSGLKPDSASTVSPLPEGAKNVTLIIPANTYTESLFIDTSCSTPDINDPSTDLFGLQGRGLRLVGDTRPIAAMTYMNGGIVGADFSYTTGVGLNNLGKQNSVVTLTNVGNTITVTTAAAPQPNFALSGVVAGDIIVVTDNNGNFQQRNVVSASANSVTYDSTPVTITGPGAALTFCPNVHVVSSAPAAMCFIASGEVEMTGIWFSVNPIFNGLASTTLTASFIQPAISSNVTIDVTNTAGFQAGQYITIAGGGTYLVVLINSATSMTITNTGQAGNASPGSTISSPASVDVAPPIYGMRVSGHTNLLFANLLLDVRNMPVIQIALYLNDFASVNGQLADGDIQGHISILGGNVSMQSVTSIFSGQYYIMSRLNPATAAGVSVNRGAVYNGTPTQVNGAGTTAGFTTSNLGSALMQVLIAFNCTNGLNLNPGSRTVIQNLLQISNCTNGINAQDALLDVSITSPFAGLTSSINNCTTAIHADRNSHIGSSFAIPFNNCTNGFNLTNGSTFTTSANVTFAGVTGRYAIDASSIYNTLNNAGTDPSPSNIFTYSTAGAQVMNSAYLHQLMDSGAVVNLQLDPSLVVAGAKVYRGKIFTLTAVTAGPHVLTLLGGATFLDGTTVKTFTGIGSTITIQIDSDTRVAILSNIGVV